MMEGGGGLKGRLLSLERVPPRFPLFLGQISTGRTLGGLMLLAMEDRRWSRASRV